MAAGPLYHFSDEPGIARFVPRSPLARPEVDALVWAIDAWHAPMYYVPRECPRACFWANERTTDADRERFGIVEGARFVMVVEEAWWERLLAATVYRYLLPPASFVLNDATAGHYVSPQAVEPLSVEPLTGLPDRIRDEGVDLRVQPRLKGLWAEVIGSTLEFSGTRLRNALD
ncbi:MAG: hypothetical protein U0547_12585 [Dehalococcoidia bacterium]